MILGLAFFLKICAIEGIAPSKEQLDLFEEFERLQLSPEERRERIKARYAKRGHTSL